MKERLTHSNSPMVPKREGDFSTNQKWEIRERYGYRCAITGEEGIWQIHHVIPLGLGGTGDIDNGIPVTDEAHQILDSMAFDKGIYYPDKRVIDEVIISLNTAQTLPSLNRKRRHKIITITSEPLYKRRSSKGNRR